MHVVSLPKMKGILPGIAIDDQRARFREDCYFCEERGPGEATIYIVSAIPPGPKVIDSALKTALSLHRQQGTVKMLPQFFTAEDIEASTLSPVVPHEALVVEYLVSGGELTREAIYFADVRLTKRYSFEEYSISSDVERHLNVLNTVFSEKRHILERSYSPFVDKIVRNEGISARLVYSAVDLFNHTCRRFARENEVPYIAIPANKASKFFRISSGYATFNRAFRDPCAFLSMTGLVYYLKHEKILLTEKEFRDLLPK